jgi:hypothetical protein
MRRQPQRPHITKDLLALGLMLFLVIPSVGQAGDAKATVYLVNRSAPDDVIDFYYDRYPEAEVHVLTNFQFICQATHNSYCVIYLKPGKPHRLVAIHPHEFRDSTPPATWTWNQEWIWHQGRYATGVFRVQPGETYVYNGTISLDRVDASRHPVSDLKRNQDPPQIPTF